MSPRGNKRCEYWFKDENRALELYETIKQRYPWNFAKVPDVEPAANVVNASPAVPPREQSLRVLVTARRRSSTKRRSREKNRQMIGEEILAGVGFREGTIRWVRVNRFERNRRHSQACINYHGCQCAVCGFDFAVSFPHGGIGFITVHHLKPLSKIRKNYKVDPINDLVPVCPNCHVMLHQREPPYTVIEMKARRNQR